ncbi:hypothetical protein R6Q59_029671 [Mikania micrantha]
MRTKKDARRLPEGYVDDVSTVRWNDPKFFVSINEDLEDEEPQTSIGFDLKTHLRKQQATSRSRGPTVETWSSIQFLRNQKNRRRKD